VESYPGLRDRGMSTAQLLHELNGDWESVVGLTVEQYHQMIEHGILESGAPIELLDGLLICKDRAKAGEPRRRVGNEHRWAVENLKRMLLAGVERQGYHLESQQAITLAPDGEPEPDGAIVRGTIDDYLQAKPSGADVSCVVEVADSSLARDRGMKQRIYADAGIPQYVIINLVEKVVEVYEGPAVGTGKYQPARRLRGGDVVSFRVGEAQVEVAASKLLP
jgi:Uma2 family endonuclease